MPEPLGYSPAGRRRVGPAALFDGSLFDFDFPAPDELSAGDGCVGRECALLLLVGGVLFCVIVSARLDWCLPVRSCGLSYWMVARRNKVRVGMGGR